MPLVTNRIGTIEYLTAESIAVPHCFTTRYGGVSTGHLASLNIGIHRGDKPENVARNYEILAGVLGIRVEDFVVTKQTHSDIVRRVDATDRGKHLVEGASPECDALITNTPGLALVVFTADCSTIRSQALWALSMPAGGVLRLVWPPKPWMPWLRITAAIRKTFTPPSAPTLPSAALKPTPMYRKLW